MRKQGGYYATVTRDDVEFEIEFSYTPGTPDVWYLPNGDPGYPGDPAELEIISITLWGVELIKAIPDDTLEKISTYLEENIDDYIEDNGGY